MRRLHRQLVPHPQIHQTKATLRIRQRRARQRRNPLAHPPIHPLPHLRHPFGISHSIAHHQFRAGAFRRFEKSGNISRSMLSVAIQHQNPIKSPSQRKLPARPERYPFPLRNRVPDYFRPRSLRNLSRVVPRTVIDDKNRRRKSPYGPDHLPDVPRFIEARNHRRALGRPVHWQEIKLTGVPASLFEGKHIGYFPN